MKKLISMMIAVTTLLSAFCAVPINAALDENRIYAVYDFEENIDGFTSDASHTFEMAQEGVGGSKGALSITEKKDGSDFLIPMNYNGAYIGKTLKISGWVRMDMKKSNITFNPSSASQLKFGVVLWVPAASKSTPTATKSAAWIQLNSATLNFDKVKNGEWIYTEFEKKNWDGKVDPQSINSINYTDLYLDEAALKDGGVITISPRFPEPLGGEAARVIEGGFKEHTWLLDDFKFEIVTEESTPNTPVVSNLSLNTTNRVGSVAKLTYDYTPVAEATDSKAIVTVSKTFDGKQIMLKQDYCEDGEYELTLTKDMAGEVLTYSVLPYDTKGGIYVPGATKSIKATEAVSYEFTAATSFGAYDETKETLAVNYSIKNNKADGKNLDTLLIVALYDSDNGLAGYQVVPISVAVGTPVNSALAVSVAAKDVKAPVAKAKAFLWSGTALRSLTARGLTASATWTKQ